MNMRCMPVSCFGIVFHETVAVSGVQSLHFHEEDLQMMMSRLLMQIEPYP
jgi:hypothetical protein